MKYRKKPLVIEAIQYNKPEDADLMELKFGENFINTAMYDENTEELAAIMTLEGQHKVTKGDYIIRGVKGELYPCKPDIFEMTYEALP